MFKQYDNVSPRFNAISRLARFVGLTGAFHGVLSLSGIFSGIEEELKDKRKVKRVFATIEEYDEKDVNLAERLFGLYGKRWGV